MSANEWMERFINLRHSLRFNKETLAVFLRADVTDVSSCMVRVTDDSSYSNKTEDDGRKSRHQEKRSVFRLYC